MDKIISSFCIKEKNEWDLWAEIVWVRCSKLSLIKISQMIVAVFPNQIHFRSSTKLLKP